jgi:hypothetical protein
MQRKKIMIRAILSFLLLAGYSIAFAQPANDNCSGAITVLTDSTCITGTTVNANDSWIGTVGCQSNGSHPDAWYSFVSNGINLSVNLSAITMTGNVEFILVQDTGNCSGFSYVGSLCGPSPLTGNITGLQIGSTYYFTISSSGNTGSFRVCIKNSNPPTLAGQDCSTAAILCNGNSVSQATSNAGFGTQEVSTANSCWGIGGERQSKWFKFTIGCSGTLEFNINPLSSTDDYDWAIWDISSNPSNCANKGNSIACNWSGCTGSTGISSCPASEPGVQSCGQSTGGDPCGGGSRPRAWYNWSAPGGGLSTCAPTTLNVTAGSTYALLVDNFLASNSGFSLTFGGACGGGTAKIGPNADFTVSGGCGLYNFNKTCQTTHSTFLWTFGDGTTSNLQNPTHTYTTAGNFVISLQVTDALGCMATTSQTVNIVAILPPAVTSPVKYCIGNTPDSLSATPSAGGSLIWYTTATGGTGSPTAPIPSTAIAGSTTYFVSQIINGCEGPRAPITVIVSAAPVMTNPDSAIFCSGNALNIPLTSDSIATYIWVAADNPQTTGESTTSITGPVINNTIINNTAAPVIVQYTVTPTGTVSGCIGATQNIFVTVNNNLRLNTSLTQSSCSGTRLNIPLISNTPGTAFTWVAANNGNTTGESLTVQNTASITDLISNSTTIPQNVIYTIIMTGGICRDTQTLNATIFPLPQIINSGSINGCNGVTLNIPITPSLPSAITWIATNNPNVNGESTTAQNSSTLTDILSLAPGTLTSQVVVYSIIPTATATGCIGDTQRVSMTINPIPGMTSGNSKTICSSDTVNLPLSASVPSLFSWIANDNPNVGGESLTRQTDTLIRDVLINNSTTVQTVTYRVTPTSRNGNCQGAVQFVTVTINPAPQLAFSGNTTLCSGAGVNISLTANNNNAGIFWTATDNPNTTGETIGSQTSNSITDNITNLSGIQQTVNYSAYASQAGCNGPSLNIPVTINPIPFVTNATNDSICSNSSVGITFTGNIPGMTYTWQAVDNPNVSGDSTNPQNNSSISDVLINAGTNEETVTYTVTGSAGNCASAPQNFTITVLPQPAMISGNTLTTCSGVPLNFSLLSNINASFSWSATNNPITTGESTSLQNSPSINDSIINSSTGPQDVIYTITPSSIIGQCAGSPQTVTATINPAPLMTSPSALTICSDEPLNIQLSSNIQATYTWVAANNPATLGESLFFQNSGIITDSITNTSGIAQIITYTITPSPLNTGCAGIPQTLTVTVNSTGFPNFAYPLNSYCRNGNYPLPSISGTLGGTFSSAPAGLSLNTTTGEIKLDSSAVGIYMITYSVGTCPSTDSFALTVKATPDPSFSYPTPLCASSGAPTVFPTPNTGNTDLYFAPAGLAFISNRTGEINPALSTPGTYLIQHSIPATPGCNSTRANFSMTIVGLPSVAAAGNAQTVCGDTAILSGNNPTYGTGVWTVINGTGNFDNINQSGTRVTGLTNGPNTFQWTITTAAPCPASSSNVVITSLPVPNASFSYGNSTYCLNTNNPTPTITGTSGGLFTATPSGLSINTADGTIDLTNSNPGVYAVSYSISGICPASSSVTLTILSPDNSSFNYPQSVICKSGNVLIPSITGLPGGSFTAVPSGLSLSSASGIIDPGLSTSGNYTVTYGSNGNCPTSTDVQIEIIDAPQASFNYTGPYCNTGTNPLPILNAGSVAGTFSVQPAGLLFANAATGEINLTASQEGTYIVTNTIPASTNCPAISSNATVAIVQAPTLANAGNPQSVCGPVTTLSGNNPVFGTGLWSIISGGGTLVSPTNPSTIIQNLSAGPNVIQWTIESSPPCPSSSSQVTIISIPKPELTNPLNATICSGGTTAINLTGNVASTFSWSATDNPNTTGESTTLNSGSIISNTIINSSGADQLVFYSVTPVSTLSNCTGNTETIIVTVTAPPQINAGIDTIAILNQPHQLMASGATNYIWSPASSLNNPFIADPLATLSSDTRFIVEGTDAQGCKGYDTVFIKVYEGPAYYVPNAFTPNGDGLNDIFTPIPVGIVSTDWFRIYNRYGQLIFESREWLKGWDGRYRGIKQPMGAYVWMIKGKSVTGQDISTKGTVLLLH